MLAVALPVLLLAAYTMTKPKKAAPKMKVAGTIYQMPQSFLLNLSDGRYAKVSVALELAPGQSDGATAGASTSSSGESSPGTLPEEPLVREIVTDSVTNQTGEALISASGRAKVRRAILLAIKKDTDIKVEQVLFPDLTVQ
jgi:flagellar FliL protein